MSDWFRLMPLRSEIKRQNFLTMMDRLVNEATYEISPYVNEEHKAIITDLNARYLPEMAKLDAMRKLRAETSKALNTKVKALSKAVRDIGLFAGMVLTYSDEHRLTARNLDRFYGFRDLSEITQKNQKPRNQDWGNAAKRILDAEPEAIAAGLPALIAPSSSQLRAMWEPFDRLLSEQRWIMLEITKLESSVYQMRKVIDDVHNSIYAYVRFNFRKTPLESLRVTLRGLGFSFRRIAKKKAK